MRSRSLLVIAAVSISAMFLSGCTAETPDPPHGAASATAGGDECAELWAIPCLPMAAELAVEIPGTSFTLHYRSDRVPGRTAAPSADLVEASFGGWTLDAFQIYAPDAGVLLSGDGTRRTVKAIERDGKLYVATRDGVTVYEFDRAGRHLRTLNATTGIARFTFGYDSTDRLISITQSRGSALTVSWEESLARLNLEKVPVMELRLSSDGLLTETASLLRNETNRFSYGSGGLVSEWTNPMGSSTRYRYDSTGRLITETAGDTVTNYSERAGTVTATVDGNRIATVSPPSSASGTVAGTWAYTDGTSGKTTEVVTASGDHTITLPDRSKISFTTAGHPLFGDQARYAASTTVASPGVPSSTTAQKLEVKGSFTSPTRVTRTIIAESGTTTTAWDNTQRTVTVTSPEGRKSVATLDEFGQTTGLATPTVTATSTRDKDGMPTGFTINDITGSLKWDDRTVSSTLAGVKQTTSFSADLSSATTTDALGRELSRDVTSSTRTTQLNGETVSVSLVGDSSLVRSFPNGNSGFDSHSIRLGEDGSTVTTGWDGGRSTVMTMDDEGRPAEITSGGVTTAISFDSAKHRVESLTRGGITVTSGEGGSGGTWTGLAPSPISVDYAIGSTRRVTAISIGDDRYPVAFSADGLLTTMGPLSLERDTASGAVSERSVNTVTTRVEYDAKGAVARTVTSKGSTQLADIAWKLDASGRLVAAEGSLAGSPLAETYAYDAGGRLIDAERNTAAWNYTWDDRDNLVKTSGPGGNRTTVVDLGNRVITSAGLSYHYNADHALASRSDGLTLATTPSGALEGAVLPNGTKIGYLLDGAERRVGRTVNGTITDLFSYHDQLRPAAQYSADGTLVASFFYDERDYLAAIVKGGTEYAVVTDQVGSPLLVIDSTTGTVAQQLSYDPFGRIITDTNPGFQPLGFLGAITDPSTGLVNLGAREYDPTLGRFLSADPLLEEGSPLNLYGYANGDPINAFDRDGLDAVVINGGPTPEQLQQLEALLQAANEAAAAAAAVPFLGTAADIVDANFENSTKMAEIVEKGLTKVLPSTANSAEVLSGLAFGAKMLSGAFAGAGVVLSIGQILKATEDAVKYGTDLQAVADMIGGLAGLVASLWTILGVLGLVSTASVWLTLLAAIAAVAAFCVAIGLCARTSGDPHTHSADGALYSYQGQGEFWGAQSADGSFGVQIRQEAYGKHVAINTAVATTLDDSVVEMYLEDSEVRVDGSRVELAVNETRSLAGGGNLARVDSRTYRATAADGTTGIEVKFYGSLSITLAASAAVAKGLSGLHGNFDGDATNEWTTPDGTVLDMRGDGAWERLHNEFGPSWRVTEDDLLLDGPSVWDPNFPASRFTIADLDPDRRAWAEQVCRTAGVSTEPTLSNCILDVGLTGNPLFAEAAADTSLALQRHVDTRESVSVGQVFSGEILQPKEVDQFTVNLAEGQIIYLAGEATNCGNESASQNGARYGLLEPSESSSATVPVCSDLGRIIIKKTGTHTINVLGANDNGTGEYRIQLFDVPQDAANTISIPGTATGTITKVGERAHYSFNATEGQIIYLAGEATNCGSNDGDNRLRYGLLGPTDLSGATVPVCSDLGRIIIKKTGTHTINVLGANDNGTGEYRIQLFDVPQDAANTISIPGTATGTITKVGERAHYSFNATEGQIIYLAGEATNCGSNDGDNRLRYGLLGPTNLSGATVPVCSDLGRIIIKKTGTHTINVLGAGDNGTGQYRITIRKG